MQRINFCIYIVTKIYDVIIQIISVLVAIIAAKFIWEFVQYYKYFKKMA